MSTRIYLKEGQQIRYDRSGMFHVPTGLSLCSDIDGCYMSTSKDPFADPGWRGRRDLDQYVAFISTKFSSSDAVVTALKPGKYSLDSGEDGINIDVENGPSLSQKTVTIRVRTWGRMERAIHALRTGKLVCEGVTTTEHEKVATKLADAWNMVERLADLANSVYTFVDPPRRHSLGNKERLSRVHLIQLAQEVEALAKERYYLREFATDIMRKVGGLWRLDLKQGEPLGEEVLERVLKDIDATEVERARLSDLVDKLRAVASGGGGEAPGIEFPREREVYLTMKRLRSEHGELKYFYDTVSARWWFKLFNTIGRVATNLRCRLVGPIQAR